MKPLQTLTQLAALGGLALTGYGFVNDAFTAWECFPLIVFFFWAHVYAHHEITI